MNTITAEVPVCTVGALKCLVGKQSQSLALVSTCQSLDQLCRPCDNTWPLALAETRGHGSGVEGGGV